MSKPAIYLDYAAATPLDSQVQEVMRPYFATNFYNPSATYLYARYVAQDIADARQRVAGWLGARPSEIIFTAGGSEANNLAVQGIMQAYPRANVVIGAIEHESVMKPAESYKHKLAKVNANGLIDLSDLEKRIDDKTVLISIMYANNEIGTIQPLKQIRQVINKILQQRRKKGNSLPLYFHTDACQAANYLDLHVNRLGVDLMTLNGGKIYGPKQSGMLYVKTGVKLQPQVLGGGQERGLRSGTENVPGIIGFAKALDIAQFTRAKETKRLYKLQTDFIMRLRTDIPSVVINGSLKHRLPNNIHITVPGQDNERLMMQLDNRGIMCAVGSACSASREEPSHVLKAIGLPDSDAQASLRFSMGRQTTPANVHRTVDTLSALL